MDPLSTDRATRDCAASPTTPDAGGPTAPVERALAETAGSPRPAEPGKETPRVSSFPEPNRRPYLTLCRLSDTAVAVVVLLGAFLIANLQRMPNGFEEFLGMRLTLKNLVLVGVFAGLWRLTCTWCGLYQWRHVRRRREEAARVLVACTVGGVCALIFPLISKTGAFSFAAVLYLWLGTIWATLGLRYVVRKVSTQGATGVREILIVGSGPRALKVYHELCERAGLYRVVGFVDSYIPATDEIARQMLGDLSELEGILMHRAVDEVLIALPIRSRHGEIQAVIESCERVGVRAKYLADVFDHGFAKPRGEEAGEFTFTAMVVAPEDHRVFLKRVIDIVGGVVGLILSIPIMLLAAVAIKLSSPGPVLFVQQRYGLNRRRFKMYKLRTMVAGAEAVQASLEAHNEAGGPVFKIRKDPRVTPVGRLLRRMSIDELPQLLNVIRGEMSLVGPRPLPARDVHRFSEAALMRRFSMRPGLTCLWQVSGRSNVRFDEWIKLDLRYIDEWSLSLDFQILFRTVPVVLKGDGAA
jgi:exopolysaccharide biosynthesis polyprenyl glycosylphosphotransferase